jgi:hypothetical protein
MVLRDDLCRASLLSEESDSRKRPSLHFGKRYSKRLSSLKRARAGLKLLAIRQDHSLKAHGGRAVLVAIPDDRHLIARFERVLAPAMIRQAVRTGTFRHPFLDVALFVGDGERDLRVWIDPIELRNRGLERGVVSAIVHGHRVVGEHWSGNNQEKGKHREERNDSAFHRDTSSHPNLARASRALHLRILDALTPRAVPINSKPEESFTVTPCDQRSIRARFGGRELQDVINHWRMMEWA